MRKGDGVRKGGWSEKGSEEGGGSDGGVRESW